MIKQTMDTGFRFPEAHVSARVSTAVQIMKPKESRKSSQNSIANDTNITFPILFQSSLRFIFSVSLACPLFPLNNSKSKDKELKMIKIQAINWGNSLASATAVPFPFT